MNSDLLLDDFDLEEINADYLPIAIDPGRKSVFTAVTGSDSREVKRCSIKEYYHLTGSIKYSVKLQRLEDQHNITDIESRIPFNKTSSLAQYRAYTEYIFISLDALFKFYDHHTSRDRFFLYQGRQRSPESMVNMLLHGTSKYNRRKRNKKKKRDKKRKKKNKNKSKGKKKLQKMKNVVRPNKFEEFKSKISGVCFWWRNVWERFGGFEWLEMWSYWYVLPSFEEA
ncbi:MAG: hypothetical protein EXX96DRAFT_320843 [Benjaminiella poitrasii]|nr:MAG: hypothetical protein EXX96DRAFT_320843 [Benjaminiella poitrasii]